MTAVSWVPPLTISLLFKSSKLPFLWWIRNSCCAHTWPPLSESSYRGRGRGWALVGLVPRKSFLVRTVPHLPGSYTLRTSGCNTGRKKMRKALCVGFPKAMGSGARLPFQTQSRKMESTASQAAWWASLPHPVAVCCHSGPVVLIPTSFQNSI